MIKMNSIECETCIRRKTIYCPNSSECFDTTDKIYYQNRIMALEGNEELVEKNLKLQNNWNELKKWLEENKFNDNYESYQVDNYTTYNDILNKMQELEQGKE